MSIWFEHNTGRWIADNYDEAYKKACDTVEPVWWGDRTPDGHVVNLQRIRRPQAPNVNIRNGKIRIVEKQDV